MKGKTGGREFFINKFVPGWFEAILSLSSETLNCGVIVCVWVHVFD